MNFPRKRPWALMIFIFLMSGCGVVVEEPAGTSSDGTSTSTSTESGGTTTTTSESVTQCPDGPPDPDCGCVGWEVSVQCGCDCGGVAVSFWDSQYQWPDCLDVPVEHACPDGWGGAGGAPSSIACEVLDQGKVCGP
jgi:hypothetical protein